MAASLTNCQISATRLFPSIPLALAFAQRRTAFLPVSLYPMAIIIGAGGPTDRQSIELATRRRRRIPNEQRLQQSPEAMLAAARMLLNNHTNYRLRSLTSLYNCVGLVFASRRTWIEPHYFHLIATDDGYQRRVRTADTLPGDVAVYTSPQGAIIHVGIIVAVKHDFSSGDTSFRVLSQFGSAGEYLHEADDLPEGLSAASGQPNLSVWSEAVNP